MNSSVPEKPLRDSYCHSGSGDMVSAAGGNATKNVYHGPTNVYHGTEERSVLPQDCWKSLAFPEIDSRSDDIKDAAEGTCKWLSEHNVYKDWASSNRALLWIKGKPGSGKSTLLRYALNNTREGPNIGEPASILSFFFHGRGSELQKTQLGLFRSLLYQLRTIPDTLSDVVEAFRQRCETVGQPGEKWSWNLGELRNFFKSSLLKALKTQTLWLFIDALDECGEENARNLVTEFTSLLKWLPTELKDFHICFTCRHYPILHLDDSFEICVENENSRDISTFVQSQLSYLPEQAPFAIPDLITERANGVFLWAWLVVKRVLDLSRDGAGLKRMEAAVLSVPQELDTLYDELLRKMEADSVKLIQWICFTTRPLSLDELRWALLVEPECPHRSLEECQRAGDDPVDKDGMKRRVQTLSRGLAEVTSDTEIVQFIHQSVKDFFVEKGLSTLIWPNWVVQYICQSTKNIFVDKDSLILSDKMRISMPITMIGIATALLYLDYFTRYPLSFLPGHILPLPIVLAVISAYWLNGVSIGSFRGNFVVGTAHYQISRTCIRYLAMDEIAQSTMRDENSLKSAFPLLHYATTSWVAHAKESEQRGVSQDDILRYFDWPSEALVLVWVRVYNIISRYADDCPQGGAKMIHIVSRYGLLGPLQVILQSAHQVGADIESKDGDNRTPLWWAARNGHEPIVRLLLEKGADTESKDRYNQMPLWWAAWNGHEAIVKLLLENGADIKSKDNKYRQTPLSLAAEKGHETIAKLLLDKGADVTSKDGFGRTPLSRAAEKGHTAIVKLLLDNGADVESKDRFGQETPLSWAAEKGHEAIVKLLLDKSADIESKDGDNRTPLSWAARNEHEAIVKLLLDKGADVESRDNYDQTPLSRAAENGHEAIIKLLRANLPS